jgi:hypothetical protein
VCHSKTNSEQRVTPLYQYLEKLIQWVRDTPPIEQPMRFGNKAFRTWLDKVLASSGEEVSKLSNDPDFANAVPEIKVYLEESFGSYERLDYGTGHELNFVVFLFCLFKLGVFVQEDLKASVNKVF